MLQFARNTCKSLIECNLMIVVVQVAALGGVLTLQKLVGSVGAKGSDQMGIADAVKLSLTYTYSFWEKIISVGSKVIKDMAESDHIMNEEFLSQECVYEEQNQFVLHENVCPIEDGTV